MVTREEIMNRYAEAAEVLDSIDALLGTRQYTEGVRRELSDSFSRYIHNTAEIRKTEYLEEGYDLLREVDRSLGLYNEIQENR